MKLVIDTGYSACNYYFFLSQKKDDNYEGVELISLSVAWKYSNCVMLLMQTWPCDRHDRHADHANINVRVIDMTQCHHFWFLVSFLLKPNFFLYFFLFLPLQSHADHANDCRFVQKTVALCHVDHTNISRPTSTNLLRDQRDTVPTFQIWICYCLSDQCDTDICRKEKQTDKNCDRDKGKVCWHSNRKEALVELR